jgi:hypothetical protein
MALTWGAFKARVEALGMQDHFVLGLIDITAECEVMLTCGEEGISIVDTGLPLPPAEGDR